MITAIHVFEGVMYHSTWCLDTDAPVHSGYVSSYVHNYVHGKIVVVLKLVFVLTHLFQMYGAFGC